LGNELLIEFINTIGNGIFVSCVRRATSLAWLRKAGWDIYFHTEIPREHKAALELRDAVLRLRRDGAFVAVPLLRVDAKPFGPHPIGELLEMLVSSLSEYFAKGSYEIWVPSESFVSVYSYLVLNRGELRWYPLALFLIVSDWIALSVLVHPLTREVVSVPIYRVHDMSPIVIIAQVTSFEINSLLLNLTDSFI